MGILQVKKQVQEKIEDFFLQKYQIKVDVNISIPEIAFGDLSSSVCLSASKKLGKNPVDLAAELLVYFANKNIEAIKTVEVKGPGFLNFWIDKSFLRGLGSLNKKNVLDDLLSFFLPKKLENKYDSKYFGKKVIVEHSSPNLFKPFHIGHLMNNFTGEFLKRAMKEAGAEVITLSYPSDISLGIAKAIYRLEKFYKGGDVPSFSGGPEDSNTPNERVNVEILSSAYVDGVNDYKKWEENGEQDKIDRVKEIANNLYSNTPSYELEIYNDAKKINIEYLYSNLEKLGSKFDGFIFESESGIVGKEEVLKNVGRVFEKSEGAIVYVPSEERKDINTTVFINSEGNPTYAGKDIGLAKIKFDKYSPDYSFYITDNEQAPHFRVVFDALCKIDKKYENRNVNIAHGRMTFRGQKMSSRLGGVPTYEDVVGTVLEEVKAKTNGRNIKEDTELDIAMSALRISVLRSKPGLNPDFDPERTLSFEGDSGPYLCYTGARMYSLLKNGKEKGYSPGVQISNDSESIKLERKVFQFDLVLKDVIEDIAPQKLVTYLFELASEFNYFYNNVTVISEDKFKTEHNLFVVKKTLDTLVKGLDILGVNVPERM